MSTQPSSSKVLLEDADASPHTAHFFPTDLRSKVIEILAATANGCLSELKYFPGMPQRLREAEQLNAQWQNENVKLFQDNRSLAQVLATQNDRINTMTGPDIVRINKIRELEDQIRALTSERSDVMKKNETSVINDPAYQRLLADYRMLGDQFQLTMNDNIHLRGYIESIRPFIASHPQLPHAQAPHPVPMPQAQQFHQLMQTGVTSTNTQQFHPTRTHGVQGPPTVPQAQSVSSRARRSSEQNLKVSNYEQPPSRRVSTTTPSQQHQQFQIHQSPDQIPLRTTSAVSGWNNPSEPVNTIAPSLQHNMTRISPWLPPFSVGAPQQAPPPAQPNGKSPSSGSQHLPLSINTVSDVRQQLPPTPPMSAQQPSHPLLPIHGSPESFPLRSQRSSQRSTPAPRPQNDASLAPHAFSNEPKSDSASPFMHSDMWTPSEPFETVTPPDPASECAVVGIIASPDSGAQSLKRSNAEMSQGSDALHEEARKKQRLNESLPETETSDAADSSEQAANHDDDSDEEIVEVGPDGLRLEEDCIGAFIGDDETSGELQTCRLCAVQFEKGYTTEKPVSFLHATKVEIIQHCSTKHSDAWMALRQDV